MRILKKIEKLNNVHQTTKTDLMKVKNLISRHLSASEQKALALGLKLATTPRKIPHDKITAATESTCKQLSNSEADQLRKEVSIALYRAKPPDQNLNKQHRQAIVELRKDSDKGNATVVMDKSDYKGKMLEMLSDPAYRRPRLQKTHKRPSKEN